MPEGREGAGSQYHYKGKPFYRIVDDFIDQAGANTDSIYGGAFKDDPGGLALKHDRRVKSLRVLRTHACMHARHMLTVR